MVYGMKFHPILSGGGCLMTALFERKKKKKNLIEPCMEKTHLHVHQLTRQVECLSVDHAAVSLHSQAVIDASAKGWKKVLRFLKERH